MWIILAFLSSFFAGITSILAKCGIRKTDSTVATAIRTIVVLLSSILMTAIVGSFDQIGTISNKSLLFLVLSGLSTGASWLCYYKALQMGDVNKVVPIDKSSTILTMIIAFIFLGESITPYSFVAIILIAIGTFMMIEKKQSTGNVENKSWLMYAVLSAIFASLTTILAKIGIENVESNLATTIRTFVVLIMSWIMVFVTGKTHLIKSLDKKELIYVCISGLSTGASWLCYYKALQDGRASVVVPIDKLSIVVSITFSYFVFKEKLSKKSFVGLVAIIVGTLLMLI